MTDTKNATLRREVERRLALGSERLTVAAMGARFAALGYALDRDSDCRAPARYLTGPHAGESYPACTTGVVEADTGLSAFNVNARRDHNFRAMQDLRGEVFAVSRNAILEA